MRTKCTVESYTVTPFVTTEKRPFEFCGKAIIDIWLTRTFTGGKNHWGNDGYKVRKYVSAKWEAID